MIDDVHKDEFEVVADAELLASDEPASIESGSQERAATPAGTARYSQAQIGRARDLLTRLYATRRAVRYYDVEHPAVTETIRAFADSVNVFHAEGVDVSLAFYEGEILMGEQFLPEESVLFDQLVRDMMSLGVGSMVIRKGVLESEFIAAMRVIASDASELEDQGGVMAVVGALNIPHIAIGALQNIERSGARVELDEADAQASYGSAVSLIREIDRLMRLNRSVSSSKVKGVVRSLVDNVLSNRYAMLQLTGLKNYDEYTFFHSANVAILSLALGSLITTDYRFLSSLGVGALLHDIGKLSVDVDVLNKPGTLTPEEWALVRQHPVLGAEIVSLLPGVDKAAVVTIIEHHMRFDGAGYPRRTPSRPQHLASRIVAVADSYDAMTSRRSYSAARVQDEAMALLVKSAGSSLDPALVRLFIRLMGVYPPQSVIRLSTEEIAIVLSPSPDDPVRPRVRVIADANGAIVTPRDVDLAAERAISVRGCIDPRALNIDVDSYL